MQAHPDQPLEAFYEQIKQGVQQGLEQAKEALAQRGLLEGDTAQQVDDIAQALQQGIEQMSQLSAASNSPTVVAASKEVTASYQSLSTGIIEIQTREGDRVSIALERAVGGSIALYQSIAGDTSTTELSKTVYARNTLQFTLQGDLNEEESQAVNKILKQLDSVSEEFFAGQLQSAAQSLSEFSFNDEYISGLTLDLSRQSTRNLVFSANTITATDSAPAPDAASLDSAPVLDNAQPDPSPADTALARLQQLGESRESQSLFENPNAEVGGLFHQIASFKLAHLPIFKSLQHDTEQLLTHLRQNVQSLLAALPATDSASGVAGTPENQTA